MGLTLHPRAILYQKHRAEFNRLFCDFIKNRDITYTELLILLNESTSSMVLKYMLRSERHPEDTEKRADEE